MDGWIVIYVLRNCYCFCSEWIELYVDYCGSFASSMCVERCCNNVRYVYYYRTKIVALSTTKINQTHHVFFKRPISRIQNPSYCFPDHFPSAQWWNTVAPYLFTLKQERILVVGNDRRYDHTTTHCRGIHSQSKLRRCSVLV